MTRQIHDQFAKRWLVKLLRPVGGKVETQREISGETYYADVSVKPSSRVPATAFQRLGLLGEMVKQSGGLLEHFWTPPTHRELDHALLKILILHSKLRHRAEKRRQVLREEALPQLWILTTSASAKLVEFCGAKPKPPWAPGIYFLADLFKTAIVAINQLPTTPETLWLRMLGRGDTQRQAVLELLALAKTDPLRYQELLELLSQWGVYMASQSHLTEDEQELLMNITSVYQQWREQTLLQGLQQGLQQGLHTGRQEGQQEERRKFVANLLKMRYGVIDEPLMEPLLRLSPEESLGLLMQLSRDELLARFSYKC
jgi:hypothetical protein